MASSVSTTAWTSPTSAADGAKPSSSSPQRSPNPNFRGYDFSADAIAAARAEAAARHASNASFDVRDAANLGLDSELDIATSFDAVHDQAHPDAMLHGIFTALRPGGTYLCVEPKASSHLHEILDHPAGPFLYGMSTMHCMTVSLAYGGDGLGAAWGEQLARRKLSGTTVLDVSRPEPVQLRGSPAGSPLLVVRGGVNALRDELIVRAAAFPDGRITGSDYAPRAEVRRASRRQ